MNASLLTTWLDTVHGRIKPGQTTIVYLVPDTTIRLILEVWKESISDRPMSNLLLRTMNYAATHISEKGDGPLEGKEDPFWLDSRLGIIFGLWSTDTRHLTYKNLASVARGVWLAMYIPQKYKAVTISVFDLTYALGNRRIGYGVIRPGSLRPPGPSSSLELPETS